MNESQSAYGLREESAISIGAHPRRVLFVHVARGNLPHCHRAVKLFRHNGGNKRNVSVALAV